MTISTYKIMIDENAHLQDEEERTEHNSFPTAAAALATCRRLVDEALLAESAKGETPEQLYARYTSFGDDPFIVTPDGAPKVSAWTYAKECAQGLAAPGEQDRLC